MIKYILSRGCRFLDLEIFSINDIPTISYSIDSEYSINTENQITLSNVLKIISENGFMKPSPNPSDPLFIQLRIKTKKTDTQIYKKIAMSLHKHLGHRLYKGIVTGSTILSDLFGKIIIIVDKSISPNYHSVENSCISSSKDCYDLKDYVNIESGGNQLRVFKYNQIINQQTTPYYINDDGISTDLQVMKYVYPDSDFSMFGILRNPSPVQLITDYGVQMIGYRFYQCDTNLQIYEKIFSDYGSAFIPMSKMAGIVNTIDTV